MLVHELVAAPVPPVERIRHLGLGDEIVSPGGAGRCDASVEELRRQLARPAEGPSEESLRLDPPRIARRPQLERGGKVARGRGPRAEDDRAVACDQQRRTRPLRSASFSTPAARAYS